MNNRLKFKTGITITYYDDEDNEKKLSFEIEPSCIYKDGDIGFYYDELLTIIDTYNLSDKEKRSVENMLSFNEEDSGWIILTPDYIRQCTGKRDKKGNLIYEGDIVKQDYKTFQGIVMWSYVDNCYYIYNNIDDKYELLSVYPNEILGNIHENADLLE